MPSTGPEAGGAGLRPVIAVACGAIVNPQGEVLIAQRPGGKIEPGESAEDALRRELDEELSLQVQRARPLIRIRHDYSDRTVVLDTWLVEAFHGEPQSRERQAFAWVSPARLAHWDLLAADAPIVSALQLPVHYVFTPARIPVGELLDGIGALPAGALLRLRQPELDDRRYEALAQQLLPACRSAGLRLMLDRSIEQVLRLDADGWHASERVLLGEALQRRLPRAKLLAVSVHDAPGIAAARARTADCAVLGPVHETPTHPGARGLGWPGFAALAGEAGLPVYAIGGVGPACIAESFRRGAQGVAGIRAYWPSSRSDGSAGASSSRTGRA